MAEFFLFFSLFFWDGGWDGPRWGAFDLVAVEETQGGTLDDGTPLPPKP